MLTLIDAGALNTIQDHGRWGFQSYGVPVSGAMDIFSFSLANTLVQNDANAAALEIRSSLTLETSSATIIALTGASARLLVNGQSQPQWTAVFVRAGAQLEITPARAGWQYLAIHGGIDVPLVLGSRATYLRGGFGGWRGRALEAGDELAIGAPTASDYLERAGESIAARVRQYFDREQVMRVVLGPHDNWFASEPVELLTHSEFFVTASADRMGYRLRGIALKRSRERELVSTGVPLGALQVPADGQPIALMADHQTTGGYPVIATVIGADIPLLAQSVEGDALRFHIVEVAEAQRAWKEMFDSFGM